MQLVKLHNFKPVLTQTYRFLLSYKIDGVQCKYDGYKWISRADKELYNLPRDVRIGIYEYYNKNWNTSVSEVRTQVGKQWLDETNLYMLSPNKDPRLTVCSCGTLREHNEYNTYTGQELQLELDKAVKMGYEGLVLNPLDDTQKAYKYKKVYEESIEVLDIERSTEGQFKGLIKSFITSKGHVGTGLTKQDRMMNMEDIIGKLIDVEFMNITPDGNFRQPVFVRVREDLR